MEVGIAHDFAHAPARSTHSAPLLLPPRSSFSAVQSRITISGYRKKAPRGTMGNISLAACTRRPSRVGRATTIRGFARAPFCVWMDAAHGLFRQAALRADAPGCKICFLHVRADRGPRRGSRFSSRKARRTRGPSRRSASHTVRSASAGASPAARIAGTSPARAPIASGGGEAPRPGRGGDHDRPALRCRVDGRGEGA